jgi:hypothetical protein
MFPLRRPHVYVDVNVHEGDIEQLPASRGAREEKGKEEKVE